jgi:DNA polymerase-3 subunit beta
MKLTIDREVLASVLVRVQGVCPQKSSLPMLANCVLEASDGKLVVRGSDLEISVETSTAEVEVLKRGILAVPAKRLFETVKGLPPGQVRVQVDHTGWAVVEAGGVHARLPTVRAAEMPALPKLDAAPELAVQGEALLTLIEKTFFAVSTDEARATFTGALFSASGGEWRMVATDGHRLCVASQKQEAPADLAPIIVPRLALLELRRWVRRDAVVMLGKQKNDLVALCGDTTLTMRLIEGRFPDFTKVIPKKGEHVARVPRDAIAGALRRAGLYTPKTGNVRLSFADGAVNLHACDPDAGEIEERVACEHAGEGLRAAFNYRYLLDVLDVVDGDEVVIEGSDTDSPTLVRDPAHPEFVFVVMPMQL